jgi:tetratricopeptide (TPR) repeat protein
MCSWRLGAETVDPRTREAEYRSRLQGKRLLVLLDNVASGAGLDALRPPPPAALLVTSRNRIAIAGVQPIELEKLSREAAVALLGEIAPALGESDRETLAGLCCDLPLALRVAGAYLQETGASPNVYIEALGQRRLAEFGRSAGDIERPELDPRVVLGLSYDRLAESDPDLARSFTLLSVFPADFDAEGAAAVLEVAPEEAARRLGLLFRRSLVQRPSDGRYRLHDLLREVAEDGCDKEDATAAARRHREHYLSLLRWCAQEYLERRVEVRRALLVFETEHANVVGAMHNAADSGDAARAAAGQLRLGILASAIGWREEALAASEEAVGLHRRLAAERPDAFRPDLARSLNSLGNRLDALGRRQEALDATDEAVAIRRSLAAEQPDAFRPDLAKSLHNLGIRLDALGRRVEALDATEEAVGLYRSLAAEQPNAFRADLASSLNNLGIRLNALGRREEALAATEEAVSIRRSLAANRPDAFRPDLAMSLNNLGSRLMALGRREEALDATVEAVGLYRSLAADRPDVFLPNLAVSLAVRADCLDGLGRVEEALVDSAEAIMTLRTTFLRHPQAVMHWMVPLRGRYLKRCGRLGVEPDEALLRPVAEVLERLESPDDGG